jgi:hypothetical protein
MKELHPVSSRTKKEPPAARWFPARVTFDPEDEGDTFSRNVG